MKKRCVSDTRGCLSIVDEIYHPEYSTFADTTGITANLEEDKTVVLSSSSPLSFGTCK